MSFIISIILIALFIWALDIVLPLLFVLFAAILFVINSIADIFKRR